MRKLLVLGLGNVLCGDDGLGVAAVERLAAEHRLPPGVEAVDGGTLGLALLARVSEADDLLIVDAIRTEAPAGTFVRLDGDDDVGPAVRERLSVHQVGVADLLDSLRLLGSYPRRVVLLGLVPATLELAYGCSPAVAAGLPELVDRVAAEVRALGYPTLVRDRHATPSPGGSLGAPDRASGPLGLP